MNQNLVWIDCEMTGLDLERDALVEVAALVTDSDLNVLGEGIDVVIKPPASALEQMGDFVREMHTSSGLLAQLEHGLELAEAERRVLEHIRQYVPEARKAPLAGNTIGTDRAFLLRQMPELEAHVHYRNVDVSSLKELARRWYPRIYFNSPAKGGNHRALADIQESIEELRYYRDTLFVAPPGPDTATCRDLARQHAGSLTGLEAVEVTEDTEQSTGT
ncbi:oligoribonuclease [Desertihabitans aurantiacus]|uniref:oligoribonuclease n=1 Tax=Desertihabitans aurantiacus TaxID=2282477 RepID=UPI000DF7DEFF|nr:oligoribonuclease [Desertihabitans aurantiacus]